MTNLDWWKDPVPSDAELGLGVPGFLGGECESLGLWSDECSESLNFDELSHGWTTGPVVPTILAIRRSAVRDVQPACPVLSVGF